MELRDRDVLGMMKRKVIIITCKSAVPRLGKI